MFKELSYLLKSKPKHPLFHLSFSFSMKLEFDGQDFISDRASVGGAAEDNVEERENSEVTQFLGGRGRGRTTDGRRKDRQNFLVKYCIRLDLVKS